jgi:hypothetical protein
MFRSETTDTLMGSGSASFEMKTERFAMAYRFGVTVTPLSVRSLSKIAHIYRLIVTGVVGGASRASRRELCAKVGDGMKG